MNKETPKISVITVVHNAVKTIEATILSVSQQRCKDYEFIIIDGESTDGTLDVINKHKNAISFLLSEPDTGIYNAMNKGVNHSTGEFIYFLGADDVLFDRDVLEKILPSLQAGQVLYGNVIFKKLNKLYDKKFNSYKLATRNISHQSIFYPRKSLIKNRFKEIYNIFADYELNIRLFSKEKFVYIPVIIAIFNDNGASGSNTRDSNFSKNRMLIIKKYFSVNVFIYKTLRTWLAKKLVRNE